MASYTYVYRDGTQNTRPFLQGQRRLLEGDEYPSRPIGLEVICHDFNEIIRNRNRYSHVIHPRDREYIKLNGEFIWQRS